MSHKSKEPKPELLFPMRDAFGIDQALDGSGVAVLFRSPVLALLDLRVSNFLTHLSGADDELSRFPEGPEGLVRIVSETLGSIKREIADRPDNASRPWLRVVRELIAPIPFRSSGGSRKPQFVKRVFGAFMIDSVGELYLALCGRVRVPASDDPEHISTLTVGRTVSTLVMAASTRHSSEMPIALEGLAARGGSRNASDLIVLAMAFSGILHGLTEDGLLERQRTLHISSWKRLLIGKGNAKKAEVHKFMQEAVGFSPALRSSEDCDMRDALCLAMTLSMAPDELQKSWQHYGRVRALAAEKAARREAKALRKVKKTEREARRAGSAKKKAS